jgi:hypothetical protein
MPYDHTPYPRPSSGFDWTRPVDTNEARKKAFHRAARKQLKALASFCGWPPASFDLRSNMAGVAVSGDITLHHEALYISVSQTRLGGDCGILIRSCKGRQDYSGGTNSFAPLDLLDDIPALADRVARIVPALSRGGLA